MAATAEVPVATTTAAEATGAAKTANAAKTKKRRKDERSEADEIVAQTMRRIEERENKAAKTTMTVSAMDTGDHRSRAEFERTPGRRGSLARGVVGEASSTSGGGSAAAETMRGVWGGWEGLWAPRREVTEAVSSDGGGATPHHTPHQQAELGAAGHGMGDGTGPRPTRQAPGTGASGDGGGVVTTTTQHTTDA